MVRKLRKTLCSHRSVGFLSFQNFLGFGQSAEIDIVFNDSENRKYAECRVDESGKKEKLLLYYDGESISGKVRWTRSAHWRSIATLITQLNLSLFNMNHYRNFRSRLPSNTLLLHSLSSEIFASYCYQFCSL